MIEHASSSERRVLAREVDGEVYVKLSACDPYPCGVKRQRDNQCCCDLSDEERILPTVTEVLKRQNLRVFVSLTCLM